MKGKGSTSRANLAKLHEAPDGMDDTLLEYATDRQREYLKAYWKEGSFGLAADALGVSKRAVWQAVKAVRAKAAQHGYAPDHDLVHQTPPGFKLRGTSTLYDEGGNKKLEWVKTATDKEQQEAMMREAVDALCDDIKPLPATKAPKLVAKNLMSIYPVGDHHIGCLAWHEEVGEDYDTAEGERLLIGAMDYLVEASQPSAIGCVVLMGDFLHYDSFESLTPGHKNLLDSDTRYPRMVRAAMWTVRHAISAALKKHQMVKVVVASGNHDPSSMVFLREALAALYEKDKRVEVDRSPKAFHYVRFGKCLVGIHHGDKVKMQDLPLLMATDRATDWGATEHRYIYTGHIHHDSAKDYGGAKVESLRVLPPTDAYAYNAGYRAGRGMYRIDLHADFGEVARQLVTPAMLA